MTHDGPWASEERGTGRPAEPDTELEAADTAVRVLLRSRVRDPGAVEDLHQEAMERLLRVRDRLDPSAVVPYAVTVAKNLVVGHARHQAVVDRNQHRLVEHHGVEQPDEPLLREEDRVAVAAALDGLSSDARNELVAHVLEGRSTIDLADASGGTAGGIAARLARTRARMRLDYLLAVRGVTLPTPDCHPVLLTLSAADQRRQSAIGAADHLLLCAACSDLAPPLLERRRALVALIPIPALVPLFAGIVRLAQRRGIQVAVGVGAVAVAAGAVVAAQPDASSTAAAPTSAGPTSAAATPSTAGPSTTSSPTVPDPPVASTASPLRVAGGPALDLLAAGPLARFAGQPVEADAAIVESVGADEGFWLGDGPGRRIWVQLGTTGESPITVRAGQSVSFDGRLVAHDRDFVSALGLDQVAADELANTGAHIEVAAADVTVRDP